jgi:tetratricopeptide (TPR) repeat protein
MSSSRPIALALLVLLAGGCATVQHAMDSLRESVGSSAAPAPETAEGKASAYRAQAAQHERRGELRPAVEAWMTAVALVPDHEPSRVALKRVRGQLDHELAERLKRGWTAVAREAPVEARQEFVAALALDPSSKSAHDGLRALAGGAVPEKPAAPTVRPATPPPARAAAPVPNGKPEVYYTAAKAHLAEGRDEEAYRALVQLERVNPTYADSPQLLGEVRQRLVRQRYQDGLRLFREERLEDAIEKWRGVLELDARHPHARRNIEQAEKMLRTLAAQQKTNR